jgi:hypothetical protein
VAVRIRPLNQNDKIAEAANALAVDQGTVSVLKETSARASKINLLAETTTEHSFTYDHVFDSSRASGAATQKDVFYGIGLPCVVS